MSWREVVRKGGTVLIWLVLLYWSGAAAVSLWRTVLHVAAGEFDWHLVAHLLMSLIYGLGCALALSMLYPVRRCPRCQGWGTVYLPHQEAVATTCPRCHGNGKVLTKRSDP